jgi:hypothetical protein
MLALPGRIALQGGVNGEASVLIGGQSLKSEIPPLS